jgi:hypothetical protein
MAGLIDAGYVARPEEDVFATTGAHLDVRVLKDGKYINPETIRSLLTRLKVGKERTPLWQQQGSTWKPAAPITSGFGPRSAPTAGASTYHPAHDYGLGAGTQLAWEGPGEFTPNKGYGSIKTTDAQGNPYEIKLLHTKGGKPAALASTSQQTAPAVPVAPTAATAGNIYNFYLQNKKQNPDTADFLSDYASKLMGDSEPQNKPLFNPTALLAAAFNSGGTLMA